MKSSFFWMIVVLLAVLLPTGAFAASFSVGSVGRIPGLTPNLPNVYSGHNLGVEVRGWLYPAGMKTPPNSKPTFGQFGSVRYAMLLNVDSSSERDVDPLGVGQDENLRSDFEFQRTMSRKLLRIVVDSSQDKRLESELLSADKPIALEGRVSDSASPILSVLQIAEPKSYDATSSATSSAMHVATPVSSRSSQLKLNLGDRQTSTPIGSWALCNLPKSGNSGSFAGAKRIRTVGCFWKFVATAFDDGLNATSCRQVVQRSVLKVRIHSAPPVSLPIGEFAGNLRNRRVCTDATPRLQRATGRGLTKSLGRDREMKGAQNLPHAPSQAVAGGYASE